MSELRNKGKLALCVSAAVLAASILVVQAEDNPSGSLNGSYGEWGGTVGDRQPVKKDDMKVTLVIRGKLASDLYKYLGRSAKTENCEPETIIESRGRGDLDCDLYKKEGVTCWFGIDPATGRSTGAIVC